MQIPRPIVLVLAASAFLAAGCGGSGPTGSGSASSPAAAAAASPAGGGGSGPVTCDAVPASLVNSALGTDLGAPSQTTAGSAVACAFKGTKTGAVEIRIQTGDTAALFAAERKTFDATGQPTKDYPGFGDQAYTNVRHLPLGLPDMNTLVARQGSVEILVASPAAITAERALEQQVFAKVR